MCRAQYDRGAILIAPRVRVRVTAATCCLALAALHASTQPERSVSPRARTACLEWPRTGGLSLAAVTHPIRAPGTARMRHIAAARLGAHPFERITTSRNNAPLHSMDRAPT